MKQKIHKKVGRVEIPQEAFLAVLKANKKNLSEKEIDEFIIAQTEDERAWTKVKLLKERVKTGSREKFLKALGKVQRVGPDAGDRIK